jgi:hypothetical protein
MKYDYEYIKKDINGSEIVLIRSEHYKELYNDRITLKAKHNTQKIAFTFLYVNGEEKSNEYIGNEINDEAFLSQDFNLFNWKKDAITL